MTRIGITHLRAMPNSIPLRMENIFRLGRSRSIPENEVTSQERRRLDAPRLQAQPRRRRQESRRQV